MKNGIALEKKILRVNDILWDITIASVFVMVTVYSHLLPVPLYIIEPMRILLFVSVLFTKRSNQYFVAVLLPIISVTISGHPPLMKSLLIVFELGLNVYLINLFISKSYKLFLSAIGSMLISKAVYYILKYIVFSVLLSEKFELGLSRVIEQIILVTIISLMFLTVIYYKNNKKPGNDIH